MSDGRLFFTQYRYRDGAAEFSAARRRQGAQPCQRHDPRRGPVYNRFEYLEERRAALEAWGRYVENLVSPPAPSAR
jgi:hypothetical protein